MSTSTSKSPETDYVPTESGSLAVARAVVDLRQGRELHLTGPEPTTMAALESVLPADLESLIDVRGGFSLLLSRDRAAILKLDPPGLALIVRVASTVTLEELRQLSGLSREPWIPNYEIQIEAVSGPWVDAALTLACQARLAPALLVNIADGRLAPADRLSVSPEQVHAYPTARGRMLERVSSARVPLAAHPECEFIVWRERFGDVDHLAIVVGQPDLSSPVLIRLHSSCLTGDLFASLRCDCGEQLQGAIARMATEGGGVLLYLSQEGRGIGLVNKLRAYQLQDMSHDTVDADRYLGFSSDERDYSMACTMLDEMGIARVRVLTNNPLKLRALKAAGIDVVERVAINIPPNSVNDRYLRTKHERAGHLGPETLTSGPGKS